MPEPSPRSAHLPRFERRVRTGALLAALPAVAGCVALMVFGGAVGWWPWMLLLAVVVATVWLARWHGRRVLYPLYTLSGLIEALRQGDYSMRGATGSVLGDVAADINALAERLQAERLQFEEATQLLGKTLTALASAVMVFDAGRRLRLVNPAAQRLLGKPRHALFGREAGELGMDGLLDGPAAVVVTHAFAEREGRFDVRHTALRRDGRGGQLLVVSDVGEVLRAEERQAWQRLLRVLGHEVNNSLAPIQSMAGTLSTLVAREPLPDDWREDFASGLSVIGNRAGALTRFLAGYSKLAKLPPPVRRRVDVAELAAKVARLEQRLPVALSSTQALCINADPDQLEQALINLVTNAVDAAPHDAGEVALRWHRDGSRAVIEVVDNGPGPPSSGNLFVPFFTTKPGGSGIGLALVRQIAEAHDGGVSLSARDDGPGSIARLWLG